MPSRSTTRRQDLLAVVAVGHAHRGRVEHRRVAQQHLVDLARRDVLAALDDQLLEPAGDEEEAVAVAVPEVAGAQPAVGREGRGGGARRSCSSRASRSARGWRSRRAAPSGSVMPALSMMRASQPEARPTAPDLALRRIQRVGEARRHAFGQAHGLDDADAELALEGQQVLRRQRRRGRAAEADARAAPRLRRRLRLRAGRR